MEVLHLIPNGAVLSYHWRQISGPAGRFINATRGKTGVSERLHSEPYLFELVVNNGSYSSFADTVQVTLKNDPPIADAGDDQIYSDLQPIACHHPGWLSVV